MPLRPESSVSCDMNEYGELEFACDQPSPVRHYTPEQLGIPRVVKAENEGTRGRRAVNASLKARRQKPAQAELQATSCHRDEPMEAETGEALAELVECAARVIGGEPVALPAGATMGAELIGTEANGASGVSGASDLEQGEQEMPSWNRLSEETKAAIAADAKTMTATQLAAKYKVGKSAIYRALAERKGKCVRDVMGRKGHNTVLRRVALPTPRTVEIDLDPQRDGSASALMSALDRIDRQESISLQFALPELVMILDRLSEEKRRAFLSAGLLAALLA